MREGEWERKERGQERCEVFNLVHPRSQFILAVRHFVGGGGGESIILLCHKTKGEEMKRKEREGSEGGMKGRRERKVGENGKVGLPSLLRENTGFM